MSNTLLVKIILPSKIILETEANMVNVPGSEGVFGVLPDHAKFTSSIDIGIITLFFKDVEKKYFVYGGIAQVTGQELNVVSEFAVDLSAISKSTILNKINNLKSDLSSELEESLEADIISGNIEKYNTLLKFI